MSLFSLVYLTPSFSHISLPRWKSRQTLTSCFYWLIEMLWGVYMTTKHYFILSNLNSTLKAIVDLSELDLRMCCYPSLCVCLSRESCHSVLESLFTLHFGWRQWFKPNKYWNAKWCSMQVHVHVPSFGISFIESEHAYALIDHKYCKATWNFFFVCFIFKNPGFHLTMESWR